jgi:hypothetical protein
MVRNYNNRIGLAILYQLLYTSVQGAVLSRGFVETVECICENIQSFFYL